MKGWSGSWYTASNEYLDWLEPSTLYLLWSRDARFDWSIGPDDGIGVFDGYFVIAPAWFAEPRGSIAPDYLVRGPKRGIAP